MISDLLGNLRVLDEVDEVVDGVDRRVHTLETLNLLADGQRVVQEGVQVALSLRIAAATATAPAATSSGRVHVVGVSSYLSPLLILV